jgi:hypothetical protein
MAYCDVLLFLLQAGRKTGWLGDIYDKLTITALITNKNILKRVFVGFVS